MGFVFKEYYQLNMTGIREEYRRLGDILLDSENFPFAELEDKTHLELYIQINEDNKKKLRLRIEELKRQARMRGVEL